MSTAHRTPNAYAAQRPQVLRLRRKNWSLARIAQALRLPEAAVYQITRDFDRTALPLTPEQLEQVLVQRDLGKSRSAAAAHAGLPNRVVFAVLRYAESAPPAVLRRLPRETPPRASLPPKVLEQAIALRQTGRSVADIARTLGCPAWKLREALPPALRRKQAAPPPPAPVLRQIEALRQQGASYREIVERTGVPLWQVRNIVPAGSQRAHREQLREQVAALHREGLSYAEIGQRFNRTKQWVHLMLPPALRQRRVKPLSPAQTEQVLALRRQQLPLSTIAQRLRLPVNRVTAVLPPELRGHLARNAPSPELIEQVRAQRAQGVTYAELKVRFQLSENRLRAVLPPELRRTTKWRAPVPAATQAQIVALRQQHVGYREIEAQTGVSRQRLQRLLSPELRRHWACLTPETTRHAIRALREQGLTITEITRQLHCAFGTATKSLPPELRRMTANERLKRQAPEVYQRILDLRAAGWTYAAIAQEVALPYGTVLRVFVPRPKKKASPSAP